MTKHLTGTRDGAEYNFCRDDPVMNIGACTSGSTAPPWGATRRGSGGSATTSTTSAEEANEAEVKMRDLIVAVKISVEDNIDGDIGGIKCPSEGRRHERRRHKR